MNAVKRLMIKGVDQEVAEKLVKNGLLTPRAIRESTLTNLKDITELSATKTRNLRDKFAV